MKEGFEDKAPPQNLDAERSVLGSILIDNSYLPIVLQHIDEEDFYSQAHKKIFFCILELFKENQPIDIITLTEKLKKKKELEEVGGVTYISGLIDSVGVAAHAEEYAKIVKEKSLLRKLIHTCNNIVKKCFEDSERGEEIIDWAESEVFTLAQKKITTGFFSLQEVMERSFEVIEKMWKKGGIGFGIPTGFIDLDRLTGGLHPQEFIVIAGRPGMGKTTFGLNIATNVALNEKIPVAIFSFEMSKEDLVKRILCSEGRVNHDRLRKGMIGDSDFARLTTAASKLADAPIYIDDTANLSVLEVKARSRRLQAEKGLGLVLIDYLQLMPGRGLRADSRQQEISEICRALKIMAKELNIPVIALSQLSRETEKRKGKDKRPVLSDLRDSGAIEQDADLVLFIYRPEVYDTSNEHPEWKGLAEIIIGKQRHGASGVSVNLTFLGEYTRFENLETKGVVI
ncbi:MAG: replicative DNA helicase [Caldiserica bacterium]|nr:MAG: replicative DNA helicase [Caldisericota bacterium]